MDGLCPAVTEINHTYSPVCSPNFNLCPNPSL